MNKKDNKFEIVLILIIIVFSLIMYGLYLIIESYYKKYTFTIITSPLTILECKKWECKDLSNNISLYNNKEYLTNIDGKDIGVNTLYYDSYKDKFYIFDYKDTSLKYNSFYMYEGNIKGYTFNSEEISKEELSLIVSKLNISINLSELTFSEIINLDFDNDKDKEYLVNFKGGESIYYNYLIYVDNDRYKVIYKSVSEDITEFSGGNISNVFDVFNDGKLEFIYHVSYYDEIGECNIIYRIKGSKYVSVNECNMG